MKAGIRAQGMKRHLSRRIFLNSTVMSGAVLLADAARFASFSPISSAALSDRCPVGGDGGRAVDATRYLDRTERRDVALKQGRIDVTAALQRALDENSNVFLPAGIYSVDPDPRRCLKLRSGQRLAFADGAVLKARGTALARSYVLLADGVCNVRLDNLAIEGERHRHRGSKGEHGMGLAILNSSDVEVDDLEVRDCWGDGIYVGGTELTGTSRNVTLRNCIAANNRRQGLTIAAVTRCRVIGGRFTGTNGIAPAAGIDVEPNHTRIMGVPRLKAGVNDVLIQDVDCSGNEGHGITISQRHTFAVTVVRPRCHDNGMCGISLGYPGGHIRVASPDCRNNREDGIQVFGDRAFTTGDIEMRDVTVTGNGENGVFVGPDVDGFTFVGGSISQNGANGVLCDGKGGSTCANGLLENLTIEANSQAGDRRYDNIRVGSLVHDLTVRGNVVRAGSRPRKPRYGIAVLGSERAYVIGNDLRGGGAAGNARGRNIPAVRWDRNAGV